MIFLDKEEFHYFYCMKTEIAIGVFDLIMILGIYQGLLLGCLFLKNATREKIAHYYQGIFLLALSLAILEEFLNNTGYILKVLPLTNFAEPLNLAYGPLLFLYVKRSLYPQNKFSKDSLHFLIFFIYLVYMGFYFFQPEVVKYNSYIYSKHPDWPQLAVNYAFSEDPLGIRSYINPITAAHFSAYLLLTVNVIWFRKNKNGRLNTKFNREKVSELKFSIIHFIVLIAVFIATKALFARDLGDYFISVYITILFSLTAYRAMNKSAYFDTPHSFLDMPLSKYKKSSLSEDQKQKLLAALKTEMEQNQYYTNNLASLSGLARRLNASNHHVSQVINEKMNWSFYEMIAWYRVESAKKLLRSNKRKNLTIEEIAEEVGYNSKSSFNTAFKKITGLTPSYYRNQHS